MDRSLDGASMMRGRRWGLLAGSALLLSAACQGFAAAQRWAAGANDLGSRGTIEDHLYDYVIPAEPWVSIGTAALLFGWGYLLVAVGIVCLGLGCRATRGDGSAPLLTAIAASAPFVVVGLHALLSGLTGFPSAIAHLMPVGFAFLGGVQVLALVVMATMTASRSRGWAVGLILLTATSVFGYVLAGFQIAPLLVGYQSYDTTPWTEGVVAGFTLLAAVPIVFGSRRARPVDVVATHA